MSDRALVFDILGRDRASAAFKSAAKESDAFGGVLKKVAGIAAGAFAGAKVVDFLKDSVSEGREAEKTQRLLANAIAATGGAAGVTLPHLDKLATSIGNQIGVDDDAVKGVDQLLLRFQGLRNAAGKGNDVFDRTTKLAFDMSTVLGTDAAGAAQLLGRALSDPSKGMLQLRRAGVVLTDQQKDQIKWMQKSGDTLGAQRILLDALSSKYGGAAAAVATPTQKLKATFKNLEEEIGLKLIPIIDKVAGFVASKLPAALAIGEKAFGVLGRTWDTVVGGFQNPFAKIGSSVTGFRRIALQVGAAVGKLVEAFRALVQGDAQGFGEVMDNLVGNSGRFVSVFRSAGELVLRVAAILRDKLGAALQWVGQHLPAVAGVVGGVLVAAFTAWAASAAAAAVATIAAAAPFIAIGAAIAGVVGGLIYAYTHWSAFRKVVDGVVTVLRTDLMPGLTVVGSFLRDKIGDAVGYVARIWPQISEAASHVLHAVVDVLSWFAGAAKAIWSVWGDDVSKIVGGLFSFVRATVENALQVVRGVIQTVLALINGDWGKAWDGLGQVVGALFKEVGALVSDGVQVISGVIGGVGNSIASTWSALWDGLKGVARGAFDWIANNVLNPLISAIDTAIDGFNKLPGVANIPKVPTIDVAPAPGSGYYGQATAARAFGGDVMPWRSYKVGERGVPEILTMGAQGGRITPVGGGGGGVHVERFEQHVYAEDGDDSAAATIRGFRAIAYLGG